MKIDGSGQRKTKRGVCSRTHGKWAGPSGYKLSRGEEGLLTGLRHGSPAHRYLSAISAWRRGLLTGLRHGSPAHRYSSGIPAWRRGSSGWSSARQPCPQVLQSHPRVAKGPSGRSSARPAVSIFGERGDTLRPARTSAYSAPGNTSHRSGARHIQWAPAYSESAWRFSRGRRRRGMNGQHIQ